MNTATQEIETQIKTTAVSLSSMKNEVHDIIKVYFSTSASALIGALASGSTPATVSSALTKTKVINGITMCQALDNFFTNAAVSTADYLSSAENLIHGSDPASVALSSDVEYLGQRLLAVGNNCISLFKSCSDLLKAYDATEASAAIGALSSTTIVFGCSTTKQKFTDGIVLCQQFYNLLGNAAVATGDYASTVQKWIQPL